MEKNMMYKDGNRVYNLNKFKSFLLCGEEKGTWYIFGDYDNKGKDSVMFTFSNELLYKKFIADYLK